MRVTSEISPDQSFDSVRFRSGAGRSSGLRRGPFRLGYLVSHPIQYQAPMLRHVAQDPDIDLTVFYMSDMSVDGFYDPHFKVRVKWDVPLLGGYRHAFLERLGSANVSQLLRPLVIGLRATLQRARLDALWLHGYKHQVQLRAIHAARQLGIPILVRGDSNLPEPSLKNRVSAEVLRRLFRKIDAFLYIGKQNRQFYAERGVEDGRLFPVPYAVDNGRFQQAVREAFSSRADLRASLNMIAEAPVILYAGKLTGGKRPLDLLAAYQHVVRRFAPGSEPYLLYAGDGEEREHLERRIEEMKLSRVRMTGFVNQSELPRYYDLCDVFVLPSEHDRWGLAVNEAMNAGKAIIVTDKVGCAADLVHDWENGFVTPAGDVVCLASRLLCVLRDNDLRARMGEASRRLVARFSFEEDLRGVKKALRAVCGSARRESDCASHAL